MNDLLWPRSPVTHQTTQNSSITLYQRNSDIYQTYSPILNLFPIPISVPEAAGPGFAVISYTDRKPRPKHRPPSVTPALRTRTLKDDRRRQHVSIPHSLHLSRWVAEPQSIHPCLHLTVPLLFSLRNISLSPTLILRTNFVTGRKGIFT